MLSVLTLLDERRLEADITFLGMRVVCWVPLKGYRIIFPHRDLSIHTGRHNPASQVLHARDKWVEAKLGNNAKEKNSHQ